MSPQHYADGGVVAASKTRHPDTAVEVNSLTRQMTAVTPGRVAIAFRLRRLFRLKFVFLLQHFLQSLQTSCSINSCCQLLEFLVISF